jgi:hypothetical protein
LQNAIWPIFLAANESVECLSIEILINIGLIVVFINFLDESCNYVALRGFFQKSRFDIFEIDIDFILGLDLTITSEVPRDRNIVAENYCVWYVKIGYYDLSLYNRVLEPNAGFFLQRIL